MKKVHHLFTTALIITGILTHLVFIAPSNAASDIGVGLSTISPVGDASLSGWFRISSEDSIQALASIQNTSPAFEFNLGGIYRHILSGGPNSGLHLGGGMFIGTSGTGGGPNGGSEFLIGFGPVAGFQFAVPNVSRLSMSFDGGAILTVFDGEANFALKGLSPALGLSIHYAL